MPGTKQQLHPGGEGPALPLTAAGLIGPVQHVVLPLLGVHDLAALALTCQELRTLVASAPAKTWCRAAGSILPPLHPGLRRRTAAEVQAALNQYTAAQRNLQQGSVMQRHSEELCQPQFSPTQDLVASVDVSDPRMLRLQPFPASSAAASPTPSVALPGRIVGHRWHPDGSRISVLHCVPGEPGLTVLGVTQRPGEAHTVSILSTVPLDSRARFLPAAFSFSPCASMIVLRPAGNRSHAVVHRVDTGNVVLASSGGWLEAVWQPDGLLSPGMGTHAIAFQPASSPASQQPTVSIIGVPSGRTLATITSAIAQYPIAFSPDGKFLALRNVKTASIDVVHSETGSHVSSFVGLAEVGWSADSRHLVGHAPDVNHCLRIVDAWTGMLKGSILLKSEGAFRTSWSPDGRLVCVSFADQVSIFDSVTCQELCFVTWPEQPMPHGGLAKLEWHNDGTKLLVHTPHLQSVVHLISFM